MMEYIVLVYLSHEDSKGLFEGKSKTAMTNSLKVIQIFLVKEKKKKISPDIRSGSHQIIAILKDLQENAIAIRKTKRKS